MTGTPGSRVSSILLVNILLLALATIALGIRLLTRALYLKAFGLDDLFCVIGYAFTFALCFVCAYMIKFGYGKHINTLTAEQIVNLLKWDFASEILYILAFVTIKMSFLFFYLRLFPGKKMAWACYALIGLLACQGIEEIAVVIFQCDPVHKAWDSEVSGHCLQLLSFFYVSFGIKLGVDLAIFILPIPVLWNTKLPRGKKFGVSMMFLLGLLICVTSIIRATFLTNDSSDLSWILVDALNWSAVEVCVAIVCACIPSFKALISIKLPGMHEVLGFSTSREKTGGPRSYGYGNTFASRHERHIRLENMATTTSGNHAEIGTGSRGDSEECIVKPDHGIRVTTDYIVEAQ